MPKLGNLVALVAGGIVLIGVVLALLPGTAEGSSTTSSTSADGMTSTTIRVDSSPDSVAWHRLRWLLAGLSVSAVVLVIARQLSLAAAMPARGGARSLPETQPAAEPALSRQPAAESNAGYWIPEGAPASIGD